MSAVLSNKLQALVPSSAVAHEVHLLILCLELTMPSNWICRPSDGSSLLILDSS